ncbi:glycosyltransferase family 2 protein [Acidocella facilis]|uniref:glycosyltransferase family 2 protein n=1 Tax=Acidocella facilis TaxID=525 RepID=UPI000478CF39|nr:glycosyltransferase family 2 protein [Acidocella facilis]
MAQGGMDGAFTALARRLRSPEWTDDLFGPPRIVGPEFDDLALQTGPADWSPAQAALFTQLQRIKPRHKLAAVVSACNDALILPEWIAHHLAIGVEKIFVYTNDNQDKTEELLRWFAQHAPVTLLPTRLGRPVDVQIKNFHHALFMLPELRLYEWVAFLDSDEFLLPAARFEHSLPKMLDAAPADAAAVLFPWHWRLWRFELTRPEGLLATHYPHATPHYLAKSVTRLDQVASFHQKHFPEFATPKRLYDTAFRPIEQGTNWHLDMKTGEGGWTEHFWGRSFAEFVVKKRRGEALGLTESHFLRDFETYFSWTSPPTAENYHPWPPALLETLQSRLAGFGKDPYFAALRAQIQTSFAAQGAALRQDAALYGVFEEMSRRFAPAG